MINPDEDDDDDDSNDAGCVLGSKLPSNLVMEMQVTTQSVQSLSR